MCSAARKADTVRRLFHSGCPGAHQAGEPVFRQPALTEVSLAPAPGSSLRRRPRRRSPGPLASDASSRRDGHAPGTSAPAREDARAPMAENAISATSESASDDRPRAGRGIEVLVFEQIVLKMLQVSVARRARSHARAASAQCRSARERTTDRRTSSRSRRSALLTAGWLMPSCRAARLTLSSS